MTMTHSTTCHAHRPSHSNRMVGSSARLGSTFTARVQRGLSAPGLLLIGARRLVPCVQLFRQRFLAFFVFLLVDLTLGETLVEDSPGRRALLPTAAAGSSPAYQQHDQ